MTKRKAYHPDRLEDAVQIGKLFRPMIDEKIGKMSQADRNLLKKAVLSAQIHFNDPALKTPERLKKIHEDLKASSQLGAFWKILDAQVEDRNSTGVALGIL